MFEDYLKISILEYPSLYVRKTIEESEMAVLDHVFFTIGNGYEWKDGVPLMPSGCDSIPLLPENDEMERHKKNLNYIFSNLDDIWYFYVEDWIKADSVRKLHLKDKVDFCSPSGSVLYAKAGNPIIDEWNSYGKQICIV